MYVSPFSVFHLRYEKEKFVCTLCEGAQVVLCISWKIAEAIIL